MNSKKVLIVANGEIKDYSFFYNIKDKVNFIIAVDGGLKHIKKLNMIPNVIIGDFDSIENIDYYKKLYPEAIVYSHPVKKDYSDLELSIEYAIEKKPEEVIMIGVTGCRLDHTITAIFLLNKFLIKNIFAKIIDEKNEIIIIDNFKELSGEKGDLLSIVPVTEKVEGIYLNGFEYPLNNATLLFGSSTGISNVFKKSNCSVKISSGKLLIIRSRD